VSVAFLVVALARGMATEEDVHTAMAVVELIDTFLTFAAIALVWRAARQRLPKGTMAITWLAAFPVLLALLCLNILYITVLRELFQPIGAPQPERMKITFFIILIICVQPAIVEEVFFRQMTLGVFRRSMNLHLAVWLTAGMFAFAHLFNLRGMPYLFLVGGVLGYARVYGGLPLAMVMHFLHNFAVVAYDAWR
jgi:membrane protease YdiL (CAAX protease family)